MFVFSNLATSIDGKIATAGRELFPLGTPYDRRMMQVIRKRADAILMGAASLRAFPRPLLIREARKQPLNAILSRGLENISPRWEFFTSDRISRVLFVTEGRVAKAREFGKTSEIVRVSARSVARDIVRALSKRGIEDLLVEGGGAVMWEFARAKLLDRLHVTLTPKLLGGTEAPTLVDGPGFARSEIPSFRLSRCRRVGDELYLTYDR